MRLAPTFQKTQAGDREIEWRALLHEHVAASRRFTNGETQYATGPVLEISGMTASHDAVSIGR